MKDTTKSERLNELERLLANGPITVAKLAERLNIDRTSVHRYLNELLLRAPVVHDEEKQEWWLDSSQYVNNISLRADESLVLYLAMRRVARQSSRAVPPVLNALEKLSTALRQPMMTKLREAVAHTWELPPDTASQAVFETLVRGWLEHLNIRMIYRGLHAAQPHAYIVSPYLFEPSPWGEGTYIIGFSDRHKGIATFKLERIERATLTTQPFTPPSDLDDNLLSHTWGVWISEGKPTRVTLRFNSKVTRRLRENRWHPDEHLLELPDGGIEWFAEVDEPQEMLPWIRGWGADVEVLTPLMLREELKAESRRLSQLYSATTLMPDQTTDDASDVSNLNATFNRFFGDFNG